MFQEPPKEGSKIRITWLPNPINHPFTKSCYIGGEGTVRDLKKDGSFNLEYENGGTLIVHAEYRYIYI